MIEDFRHPEELKSPFPDWIRYRKRLKPSLEKIFSQADVWTSEYGFDKEIAKTAAYYFNFFDIGIKDLAGKRIIDIGSGSGGFKKVLGKLSPTTEVINLDDAVFWERFVDVRGRAEALPFEDGSFDLVFSHCAVPIMQATSGQFGIIPKTLQEILRVTKPGGEIRIYPFTLVDFAVEDSMRQEDYSHMNFEVLKELENIHRKNPDVKIGLTELRSPPTEETSMATVLELRK